MKTKRITTTQQLHELLKPSWQSDGEEVRLPEIGTKDGGRIVLECTDGLPPVGEFSEIWLRVCHVKNGRRKILGRAFVRSYGFENWC